jgi:hypothetical protein
MCCTCRLGQPPPSQWGTLLYFQLRARFGGPPWWAIMPPLTSKRVASRPIPILAARPSFAPKTKRCPTSCLLKSLRSAWDQISFNGDYVWPSQPLKQKVSALRNLCSAFLDAVHPRSRGFLHNAPKRFNPGSRRQSGVGFDPDFSQFLNDFAH